MAGSGAKAESASDVATKLGDSLVIGANHHPAPAKPLRLLRLAQEIPISEHQSNPNRHLRFFLLHCYFARRCVSRMEGFARFLRGFSTYSASGGLVSKGERKSKKKIEINGPNNFHTLKFIFRIFHNRVIEMNCLN
jgi:hypothetical protein